MLYIWKYNKEKVYNTQGNWVIEQWGESKDRAPITWGANWDYFGAANYIIITLYPGLCWVYEVLITTYFTINRENL